MGLPKKYCSNNDDGWVIEDKIEESLSWEELELQVHPEWETTRDYANKGEMFGILDNQPANQVPQRNLGLGLTKNSMRKSPNLWIP
jgi:hypothetical protein